jgi:hypothetical protein
MFHRAIIWPMRCGARAEARTRSRNCFGVSGGAEAKDLAAKQLARLAARQAATKAVKAAASAPTPVDRFGRRSVKGDALVMAEYRLAVDPVRATDDAAGRLAHDTPIVDAFVREETATVQTIEGPFIVTDNITRGGDAGAPVLNENRELVAMGFPEMPVLSFPAIAEKDERFRLKGEALFPSLKPLGMLLDQKKLMSEASWQAEYQQRPCVVGGGIFPIEKLQVIPIFDRREIASTVLAVDKAGTAGGDGAYTAIVIMHKMKNGNFVIERVVRGRWGALEREKIIKYWADATKDTLMTAGGIRARYPAPARQCRA